MIQGVHSMFYSSEPEALRTFFRDKLKLSAIDVGGGWLIFDFDQAEVGVHPADEREKARSGVNEIAFYCDDIEMTVADLKSRGVEFTGPIEDQGYGLVTNLKVPGGFAIMLYERKYTGASSPKAK